MNAKQVFKNTLDVALSEVLRKMGFQKFDNLRRILLSNGALEEDIADVPDSDIWLIPADQYDNIPKGYPVVDIFGNQTTFEGRKTCCKGDVRCGVLPIGILRPAEPDTPAAECKFITGRAFIKSGKFYATGVPATESFMLQYAIEASAVLADLEQNRKECASALNGNKVTLTNLEAKLSNDMSSEQRKQLRQDISATKSLIKEYERQLAYYDKQIAKYK